MMKIGSKKAICKSRSNIEQSSLTKLNLDLFIFFVKILILSPIEKERKGKEGKEKKGKERKRKEKKGKERKRDFLMIISFLCQKFIDSTFI